MISHVLGGLGLFLLGMTLSTQALRTLAGDSMRRLLLRFTGGPVRAMLSGTVITALVQSSSATTLATIGFVGAGLISFQQSIGLIFGANLGTTATAWLVALVGLKVHISALALPVLGIGAFLHVFGRGRLVPAGLALAGFGLIFLGIDLLQEGMASATDVLTPSTLPADTLLGRLALVGLGVVITAVINASGAAVAMAMTALAAGNISLEQAAALVIGANVGTTATALLGAIGSTISARRASLAHVLFNLLTGVVAFVALPLLTTSAHALSGDDPALALAIFHTAFNLLGVVLLLPVVGPFSRLILRILKEPPQTLTRFLDPRVVALGPIAAEAVRRTTLLAAGQTAGALADLLQLGPVPEARTTLAQAAQAVEQTQQYLSGLRVVEPMSLEEQARHLSTLHALDHLALLVAAGQRIPHPVFAQPHPMATTLAHGLRAVERWAEAPRGPTPAAQLALVASDLHATYKTARASMLEATARGELDPLEVSRRLDALRWIEQLGHDADRMTTHLVGPEGA